MHSKLTRTLIIAAVAASAVAIPAAQATAAPAHSQVVKVGPKQDFEGLVNAKPSKAGIRVICPGISNTGHPLAHQTVAAAVVLPPLTPNDGFTGTAATSIAVWLTWPTTTPPQPSPPPSPAYVATFTSYGTMPIPTSIRVPCGGSGEMLFLPAPGSPTVKAATVSVTFANIGA